MIDRYVKNADDSFRLADVEHWIFECGRYLFLSKIRLYDDEMIPEMCYHPIETIEKLMELDMMELEKGIVIHQLFQKIIHDWWDNISLKEIEDAQSNLLILLKNVKLNSADEFGERC